jgi:hypothetical protein
MAKRTPKEHAKTNGKAPLDEAARDIPTGTDAEQALRVLADLNDRVKRLERVEADKKAAYLDAKMAREGAQETLGAKLWQFTHPPDLPLLDVVGNRRQVTITVP